MPGILHIFRMAEVRDRYDRVIAEYQPTYLIETGNSYSKVVIGDSRLAEFLRAYAVVPTGQADRALYDLRNYRQATIPNVQIHEKDLTGQGLSQSSSDY